MTPPPGTPSWPGSAKDRTRFLFARPGDARADASQLAWLASAEVAAVLADGSAETERLATLLARRIGLSNPEAGALDASSLAAARERLRGKSVGVFASEETVRRILARELRCEAPLAPVALDAGRIAILDLDDRGPALRALNAEPPSA